MLIGGSLLLHGEKWAATVDDRATVRIIHDQLKKALQQHESIAAEIKDSEAREEYLAVFADDVRRCEAVIETCAKRLDAWTKEET